MEQYKKLLGEIKEKVIVASRQKFDIKKVISNGSYIYDYNYNKGKYLADRIKRSSGKLVEIIDDVHKKNKNPRQLKVLNKILMNSKHILEYYLEPKKVLPIIEQIEKDLMEVEKIQVLEDEISEFEKEAAARPTVKKIKTHGVILNFDVPELPEEISDNVLADVEELKRCFESECYRSSIILCGRIIETALHRKYFEITGVDALEKNPGIGLGKLIAKMREKNIKLDPALPQQIHFINQARIFSVHTKQEAFAPSKNQAQATVLYTMDVLGKFF